MHGHVLVGALLLAACGAGRPEAPSIESFVASRPALSSGQSAQLTAIFRGGAGTIDQGVGSVRSGSPVTVAPAATTVYTLSVSGNAGQPRTATVSVQVATGAPCIGKGLLQGLGRTAILAGASMKDATAAAAPFDGRYLYLAGGLPDGAGPCASCASGCATAGTSCASSGGGCAWWGCWQSDQVPPGDYLRSFVAKAESQHQIPWVSYDLILQASGKPEGVQEVSAANDAAFLGRYLSDFRFFLQQVGAHVAFVHVEPDFWGYAQRANRDPHLIPAAVQAAAPADCGSQENSIAGLGRCMIAMARKFAPGVRIGLHASSWGPGTDALLNTNASFDVAAEARTLGGFMTACGSDLADFIVVDASDRDAGYYQSLGKATFWDPSNASLPSFHQAFAWATALAESTGVPVMFWQVPVGNAAQGNTTEHWKDNRVDYFFANPGELAAAHVAGMFFGAGTSGQTTPETDGGNLVAKAKAYAASGGQALCP